MTLRRYEPQDPIDDESRGMPDHLDGEILRINAIPYKEGFAIDIWVGPYPCDQFRDEVQFFRDLTNSSDPRDAISFMAGTILLLGAKIPDSDWYENGFENLEWPFRRVK